MSLDILGSSYDDIDDIEHYSGEGTYIDEVKVGYIGGLYPGYKLGGILGRGHFGEVWDAMRESDGKIIALKIIQLDRRNPNAQKDIEREIRILMKISNPECKPFLACINSYKYLSESGKFLIEMELVDGQRLNVYAKSIQNPTTLYRHLLLIMKDIVKGLLYLHRNGIIHNDVKPDNIIIDENLTPVLVDFGVSCDNLTVCDLNNGKGLCCKDIKGPNMYISPETIKTRGKYFPQSDVWSLGVTFYNVATGGNFPFKSGFDTFKQLTRSIARGELLELDTRNPTLNYIVNRALVKDPLERISLTEIDQILRNI